jgi:DNA-directed RNA polymerase specialized sigma24 family protein
MQRAPSVQSAGQDWIQPLREGDVAAFESLFRAFAPGLCTFVTRYVDSRTVAEDLVQDLFLTLWRKREEIRWPRTWCRTSS